MSMLLVYGRTQIAWVVCMVRFGQIDGKYVVCLLCGRVEHAYSMKLLHTHTRTSHTHTHYTHIGTFIKSWEKNKNERRTDVYIILHTEFIAGKKMRATMMTTESAGWQSDEFKCTNYASNIMH